MMCCTVLFCSVIRLAVSSMQNLSLLQDADSTSSLPFSFSPILYPLLSRPLLTPSLLSPSILSSPSFLSCPSLLSSPIALNKSCRLIDIETGLSIGTHDGKEALTVGQGARAGGCSDKYFVASLTAVAGNI